MKRLLLAALTVCAACQQDYEPEIEIEPVTVLPFAEVGRGKQALVDTVLRVILSRAEWEAVQDSLIPLRPFTPVSFEHEMVLVAAFPVRTGGYDLRFEEVEDAGSRLLARYRLYIPGQDCRLTVGAGNTFQVVRVARSDKPVTFERIEEALDCTEP